MRNLKNKIINYLTNGQGFVIESYNNSQGNIDYIAIKEVQNGEYAVIINDDYNDMANTQAAINFLDSRGKHYNLNRIVLSNKGYADEIYNTKRCVVNETNGNIMYCDERCEVLARIVSIVSCNNKGNSNYRSVISSDILKDKTAITTLIIIGLNVLIYLISAMKSGSLFDIDAQTLVNMGGQVGIYIKRLNEWWRLFTCMFLHGSIIHLLCNMFSLFYLGPQIERIFGRVKFIIIYILSGIGASLFSYYVNLSQENLYTVSIGASGAIFGLLGALLIFFVLNRKNVNKRAITDIGTIVVLNLFIGFSSSGIDNAAHIGGLIIGAICSFIFSKLLDARRA